MPAERAYLDHNATTPLRPAAAQAMIRALETCGNPSSVHAEGRAMRAAIDKARTQVAMAVGGEAKNVIFTSGATEAFNTLLRPSPAIISASGAKHTNRLLVLATEHSAVLRGGGFTEDAIEQIPATVSGHVDLAWLEQRLVSLSDAKGLASVTVAIQCVNSETGVIQPVSDASRLVHRFGALLVCDAVAALGKIPVKLAELNADALVFSAHKFGGPVGAGAIVLNASALQIAEPLLRGGGQEMRQRSGTENSIGIIGMGAAAEAAVQDLAAESARLLQLRSDLLRRFRQVRADLHVFGETAPHVPNTIALAVPGLKSETAVINFDLAGVAISAGAACASGKVKRSHVLEAMGVAADLADCALRFSLGWTTRQADIDKAVAVFAKVAAARRSIAA
jgi:cysteine desulfurase